MLGLHGILGGGPYGKERISKLAGKILVGKPLANIGCHGQHPKQFTKIVNAISNKEGIDHGYPVNPATR